MASKIFLCFTLIFFTLNLITLPSEAQMSAYHYGYPGSWGYYGYRSYGNPYYMYSSGYGTPATSSSGAQVGGHPAISASGGISASLACANCGFGRN